MDAAGGKEELETRLEKALTLAVSLKGRLSDSLVRAFQNSKNLKRLLRKKHREASGSTSNAGDDPSGEGEDPDGDPGIQGDSDGEDIAHDPGARGARELLDDPRTVTLQLGARAEVVPVEMRRELWLSAIVSRDAEVASFPRLISQDLASAVVDADILKDCHRTYPAYRRFSTVEGRASLRNVLKAYAAYDPEVAYCQGMNFVAGCLLMFLPTEAHAFAALVTLMQDRGLAGFYGHSMPLLQEQLWHLGRLLPPDLAAHMEACGVVPVLYGASWLMTVFAADFPIAFSARVLDALLVDHCDSAMLKVAVSLLKHAEPELMACRSLEDMLAQLKMQVPCWPEERLHAVLQDAFTVPWSRTQQAILACKEGQESVAQSMQRVNNNTGGGSVSSREGERCHGHLGDAEPDTPLTPQAAACSCTPSPHTTLTYGGLLLPPPPSPAQPCSLNNSFVASAPTSNVSLPTGTAAAGNGLQLPAAPAQPCSFLTAAASHQNPFSAANSSRSPSGASVTAVPPAPQGEADAIWQHLVGGPHKAWSPTFPVTTHPMPATASQQLNLPNTNYRPNRRSVSGGNPYELSIRLSSGNGATEQFSAQHPALPRRHSVNQPPITVSPTHDHQQSAPDSCQGASADGRTPAGSRDGRRALSGSIDVSQHCPERPSGAEREPRGFNPRGSASHRPSRSLSRCPEAEGGLEDTRALAGDILRALTQVTQADQAAAQGFPASQPARGTGAGQTDRTTPSSPSPRNSDHRFGLPRTMSASSPLHARGSSPPPHAHGGGKDQGHSPKGSCSSPRLSPRAAEQAGGPRAGASLSPKCVGPDGAATAGSCRPTSLTVSARTATAVAGAVAPAQGTWSTPHSPQLLFKGSSKGEANVPQPNREKRRSLDTQTEQCTRVSDDAPTWMTHNVPHQVVESNEDRKSAQMWGRAGQVAALRPCVSMATRRPAPLVLQVSGSHSNGCQAASQPASRTLGASASMPAAAHCPERSADCCWLEKTNSTVQLVSGWAAGEKSSMAALAPATADCAPSSLLPSTSRNSRWPNPLTSPIAERLLSSASRLLQPPWLQDEHSSKPATPATTTEDTPGSPRSPRSKLWGLVPRILQPALSSEDALGASTDMLAPAAPTGSTSRRVSGAGGASPRASTLQARESAPLQSSGFPAGCLSTSSSMRGHGIQGSRVPSPGLLPPGGMVLGEGASMPGVGSEDRAGYDRCALDSDEEAICVPLNSEIGAASGDGRGSGQRLHDARWLHGSLDGSGQGGNPAAHGRAMRGVSVDGGRAPGGAGQAWDACGGQGDKQPPHRWSMNGPPPSPSRLGPRFSHQQLQPATLSPRYSHQHLQPATLSPRYSHQQLQPATLSPRYSHQQQQLRPLPVRGQQEPSALPTSSQQQHQLAASGQRTTSSGLHRCGEVACVLAVKQGANGTPDIWVVGTTGGAAKRDLTTPHLIAADDSIVHANGQGLCGRFQSSTFGSGNHATVFGNAPGCISKGNTGSPVGGQAPVSSKRLSSPAFGMSEDLFLDRDRSNPGSSGVAGRTGSPLTPTRRAHLPSHHPNGALLGCTSLSFATAAPSSAQTTPTLTPIAPPPSRSVTPPFSNGTPSPPPGVSAPFLTVTAKDSQPQGVVRVSAHGKPSAPSPPRRGSNASFPSPPHRLSSAGGVAAAPHQNGALFAAGPATKDHRLTVDIGFDVLAAARFAAPLAATTSPTA